MKVIVDTNVAVVANGHSPQASPACVDRSIGAISDVMSHLGLILDDNWHILTEYMNNLNESGQPGLGDAFGKWVLTNWMNARHCQLVPITPHLTDDGRNSFEEFPKGTPLHRFDPSDHKFVAVAVAYKRIFDEMPAILNAVDTDWWEHHHAFTTHNIQIEFLCPEAML